MRTVIAIITFRYGSHGLLLSELGGYILSPAQAPAGTKRLSNLLRSKRWGYEFIEQFLWQCGDVRVQELKAAGEEALLEKAGSLTLEGLGSVRSSVARWLKRIKRGFYTTERPDFCARHAMDRRASDWHEWPADSSGHGLVDKPRGTCQ